MQEERENKAYTTFRVTVDMAMGSLYIFISVYCMQFPALLEEYGKATVYSLGALFSLYGLFRLFRGYVKARQLMKNGPPRRSSRQPEV